MRVLFLDFPYFLFLRFCSGRYLSLTFSLAGEDDLCPDFTTSAQVLASAANLVSSSLPLDASTFSSTGLRLNVKNNIANREVSTLLH